MTVAFTLKELQIIKLELDPEVYFSPPHEDFQPAGIFLGVSHPHLLMNTKESEQVALPPPASLPHPQVPVLTFATQDKA